MSISEAIIKVGIAFLLLEYVTFVLTLFLLPVVWFVLDLVDRKQSKLMK